MHRFLSGSHTRKAVAMCVAVVGFVWLYETRILDSQHAAWQAVFRSEQEPEPGARLPFSATAYCKGTTTASGVRVRTGVAAADPQLLPVGSVVQVAVGDSKYSGVYTVMDTGPAVQGRVLDLYVWSCHEALQFGRRPVNVTVLRLGWDPQASSPTLVERLFKKREANRRTPRPVPRSSEVAPDAVSSPTIVPASVETSGE
jgi:3D (Asp-Asp-Asp) domain-containing protein